MTGPFSTQDPVTMSLDGPNASGKAPQACLSCKKQKRKCSKDLPNCSLCQRMNRPCDYSDFGPTPTPEDFYAMQRRLQELESRLDGSGGATLVDQSMAFGQPPPPSVTMDTESPGVPTPVASEPLLVPFQNKFPAMAFLDSMAFSYAGMTVPRPQEVLHELGDGNAIQAVVTEYFSTIHRWLPIVSRKRMTQNLSNPKWEAGPDLALLFLAMRVLTTHPADGVDLSQTPPYLAVKRFLALMESCGMASLHVLQAYLLVAFYEYGHCIYPAAWMSSAACARYGSMLGIHESKSSARVLARPSTWTEIEERRRTWWAVVVLDLRGHSRCTNPISPASLLPSMDAAWDKGQLGSKILREVGDTPSVAYPTSPYARVCQAAFALEKIMVHCQSSQPPAEELREAFELHRRASGFVELLAQEANESEDLLAMSAALAVSYSAMCYLCDQYSCPECPTGKNSIEIKEMQVITIEGLKSISSSIVQFIKKLTLTATDMQGLSAVSPLILDALYNAGSNYAWFVRESGDAEYQHALDSIRESLRWLGSRWRAGQKLAHILGSQEFSYTVDGES